MKRRERLRRALLVGIIALSTSAVCTAAWSAQDWNYVPHRAMGFISCTDTPYAWIRVDYLDHWEAEAIASHEADHVDHVHEIGGCKRFINWIGEDTRNRLEAEARAYCASAVVMAKRQQASEFRPQPGEPKLYTLDRWIGYFALRLIQPGYGFAQQGLDHEQAVQWIRSECGEALYGK